MKKKGFTLIELLGVIVVLAFIALIAVPLILGMIEKSKKGAAKSSALGYIEVVEFYQAKAEIDNSLDRILENTKVLTSTINEKIDVKGNKPEANDDYIKLNDKGKVGEGKLTFNGYEIIIKDGKVDSITKIEENTNKPSETVSKWRFAKGEFGFEIVIDNEGSLWTISGLDDTDFIWEKKEDTKFQSVSFGTGFDCAEDLWAIDIEGNLWNAYYGDTTSLQWYKVNSEFDFDRKLVDVTNSNSCRTGFIGIDEERNLWGYGNNEFGQLGDGTTENKSTPVLIKEGTKFQNVFAGIGPVMAIDIEGNLWGWGDNEYGQLGDGTTENKNIPALIKEGTKFQDVITSYNSTMAIDIEGNLWGWGNNENGQLGDGTTENRLTPVLIKEGTKFQRVAITDNSEKSYAMAIDIEGNLWGWGNNENGQLGDGTTENRLTPVLIKEGTKFQDVTASYEFTMAIDIEGNLWGFGEGFNPAKIITTFKN